MQRNCGEGQKADPFVPAASGPGMTLMDHSGDADTQYNVDSARDFCSLTLAGDQHLNLDERSQSP